MEVAGPAHNAALCGVWPCGPRESREARAGAVIVLGPAPVRAAQAVELQGTRRRRPEADTREVGPMTEKAAPSSCVLRARLFPAPAAARCAPGSCPAPLRALL